MNSNYSFSAGTFPGEVPHPWASLLWLKLDIALHDTSFSTSALERRLTLLYCSCIVQPIPSLTAFEIQVRGVSSLHLQARQPLKIKVVGRTMPVFSCCGTMKVVSGIRLHGENLFFFKEKNIDLHITELN